MMNKATAWKDGNVLILKCGDKFIVNGKSAYAYTGENAGGVIDAEDYDDDLRLIHGFGRKGRYDVVDVRPANELFMDEWPGKPIPGKAWNSDDGYKYDVTIIGYCHDRWVCENANQCLDTFEHVEHL